MNCPTKISKYYEQFCCFTGIEKIAFFVMVKSDIIVLLGLPCVYNFCRLKWLSVKFLEKLSCEIRACQVSFCTFVNVFFLIIWCRRQALLKSWGMSHIYRTKKQIFPWFAKFPLYFWLQSTQYLSKNSLKLFRWIVLYLLYHERFSFYRKLWYLTSNPNCWLNLIGFTCLRYLFL